MHPSSHLYVQGAKSNAAYPQQPGQHFFQNPSIVNGNQSTQVVLSPTNAFSVASGGLPPVTTIFPQQYNFASNAVPGGISYFPPIQALTPHHISLGGSYGEPQNNTLQSGYHADYHLQQSRNHNLDHSIPTAISTPRDHISNCIIPKMETVPDGVVHSSNASPLDISNMSYPSVNIQAPAYLQSYPIELSDRLSSSDRYQSRFNEMFALLQRFHSKHGHVNVPYPYCAHPELGAWVKEIRKNVQSIKAENEGKYSGPFTPMMQSHIKALDSLGFRWSFSERFDESSNGNSHSKQSTISNGVLDVNSTHALPMTGSVTTSMEEYPGHNSGVVSTSPTNMSEHDSTNKVTATHPSSPQDFKLKKKITTNLKPLLSITDNLGLNPIPQNISESSNKNPATFGEINDSAWNERYKSLAKFRSEHGHCHVPARYKKDPRLGHWVMTQRRQYHLLSKGRPSSMSNARVEKLEALGFAWSIRMEPEKMWNQRYNELKAYKSKYGDCLVPQRFSKNPRLGTWVNTQRRHYKLLIEGKHSCITPARVEALQDLGFVWSTTMGGINRKQSTNGEERKCYNYDIEVNMKKDEGKLLPHAPTTLNSMKDSSLKFQQQIDHYSKDSCNDDVKFTSSHLGQKQSFPGGYALAPMFHNTANNELHSTHNLQKDYLSSYHMEMPQTNLSLRIYPDHHGNSSIEHALSRGFSQLDRESNDRRH
mmetsp:Transcript_1335/g.1924  ORF Transcript_1335/g.1924 Transcript_1335/m.1924 type:complete len:706 (-) Transcript_1335:274-2391(-)|eukprot:CAMPEP_0184861440 /NCGR_PEP_ID=MMETSP0580-20130426/6128_1 /TAXON_ID=1118495 /ORGANISM="Dactyliosolen fragilissimus" /LENGTH=705 /DNA_ID=CAMNT_0027358941 /DNA_START=176 /DNA_END=2293 /DNA_ORIENTATION=-